MAPENDRRKKRKWESKFDVNKAGQYITRVMVKSYFFLLYEIQKTRNKLKDLYSIPNYIKRLQLYWIDYLTSLIDLKTSRFFFIPYQTK